MAVLNCVKESAIIEASDINMGRSQWAENEFGKADLGDPRRTDRLVRVATDSAAKPSVSLPQCFVSQG